MTKEPNKRILQPLPEKLTTLLKQDLSPSPLLVRSGGTSSRCSAPGHWTLDLSRHFRGIAVDQNSGTVRVETGLTTAEVQTVLNAHKRSLPTGLSGLPGAGYWLTGGISPLSRSQGLAIDRIQAISGVWGSGERFDLCAAKHGQTKEWRALLGAAPFLAIVTSISMMTTPLQPLQIGRGVVSAQQLFTLIQEAEHWPEGIALHWFWAERIEVLVVALSQDRAAVMSLEGWLNDRIGGIETLQASQLAGLAALPALGQLAQSAERPTARDQEVLGLLGPAWGDASKELIQTLVPLMGNRPDHRCSFAGQQLGGCTAQVRPEASSFVHRTALWKPWITAAWTPGDAEARKRSLHWLEAVRDQLLPLCPGVHLAQLHDHLPWHERELEAAFADWLPQLRELKRDVDPLTLLPRL